MHIQHLAMPQELQTIGSTTSTTIDVENKVDNSNYDDAFVHGRGSSIDTHHQIAFDEYRKMFHVVPNPP